VKTFTKSAALLSTLIAFSALAACAPDRERDMSGATPAPPSTELGQCKADAYRSYIGKSRSELPGGRAGRDPARGLHHLRHDDGLQPEPGEHRL
jgi:hypothetical protein